MEAAAVSYAEGSLKTLLSKITSVLAQEAGLLSKVRSEIRYLREELVTMHALLRNLSRRDDHDDQVKEWMRQVRELAYDVEDCIDEFIRHLGGPCGDGFLGQVSRSVRFLRTIKIRYRVAHEIEVLKKISQDISDRRSRYSITMSTDSGGMVSGNYLPLDPRLPSLFVEEPQLVGIEDRIKAVLKLLLEESVTELRVIPIVGFGGLGKTTLAISTFQTPIVKSCFQCLAFITVSQKFDTQMLLKDLWKQLTRNEYFEGLETCHVIQLANKLREYLQNKRYFVILDDIWSISAWESIKCALPDDTTGSRIIVTTRIKNVANFCCSQRYGDIYEIQPLDENEAQKLFFKKIFGTEICPPNRIPDLEDISKKILDKCKGLPLAIISIAGLLATKPKKTKELWTKVYESIGSEMDTDHALEGLKQILSISYRDLPHHLKTCFLYLSGFPEDCVIRKKVLVRKWIAEGFVSKQRGLSMEETAENYFNELVNRNVIEPLIIGTDGRVKTCKVHDIMLEIIVSKSSEENFVSLVSDHNKALPDDRVRRLSVYGTDLGYLKSILSVTQLRTLTVFGNTGELPVSLRLKLLRVLDLADCKGIKTNHLDFICELFLLKYLSLRNTRVTGLPKKIGKLGNLETLDLCGTCLNEFPAGLVELHNLSYFLVDNGNNMKVPQMPIGISKMRAMQTLADIYLSKDPMIIRELGYLTQLRKLGFIIDTDERESWIILLTVLTKLGNCLRSLKIVDESQKKAMSHLNDLSSPLLLERLSLSGYLGNLPRWIASLDSVVEITLSHTELENDSIRMLEKLPNLLCLRLFQNSFTAPKLIIGAGFQNLKSFQIHHCLIQLLVFENKSMPNLEFLEMCLVPLLDCPEIENLLNIKKIVMKDIRAGVSRQILRKAGDHPNNPNVLLLD